MYHPVTSPSFTSSTTPFHSHPYKYKATSKSGGIEWGGVARVPSAWGTVQVRKALREAMPEAFILETSWAPGLETRADVGVDHDFSIGAPPAPFSLARKR